MGTGASCLHEVKLFFRREIFLANTADGTYPVVGKVFERSSGFYSIIRITFCGIVDIAAGIAYITLHIRLLFPLGFP